MRSPAATNSSCRPASASAGGQLACRAPRDEAGAAAGDVDELADDVGIDLGDEVVEVEVEVVDAVTESRREVIAQVFGRQVIEPGARGDQRAARLGHLQAVHGQEAVREHRRRRTVARADEHGRPEQRVEVHDVLADEVIHLGGAVRLPVLVEIAPGAAAVLQQAREVADGRVEPDVEVLAGLAGNLEAEIRLVARDVPVAQARAEPFAELRRDGGLQAVAPGPVAQHRLEVAELEEQVLRFLLHGRRAAHDRDRVQQVGRRVGGAADFAAVAVLVERAALGARAAHVAIGQEHLRLLVVRLHDRLAPDVAAGDESAVDLVRDLAVLVRVRGVEVVVRDVELAEVAALLGAHALDELLRRDAFLPRLEHDRRAVRVARPDEQAVVAAHALEAHPDVGLDVLDDVPEVRRAVGVRQRAGDEDRALGLGGHGAAGSGSKDRQLCQSRSLTAWLAARSGGTGEPGTFAVQAADPEPSPELGKADTRSGEGSGSVAYSGGA